MNFGIKLRDRREAKSLSQSKLAQAVGVHQSNIGRYERNEAKQTIDVVSRISKALGTTIGYLRGENEDDSMFKDHSMLKRYKDIIKLPIEDQNALLHNVDAYLRDYKTGQTYAS